MAHLDFSLELSRFACGVAIGPRATCRGRLLALTVVGCRVQFEADWVAMTKITVASAARAAMYSPGAFSTGQLSRRARCYFAPCAGCVSPCSASSIGCRYCFSWSHGAMPALARLPRTA